MKRLNILGRYWKLVWTPDLSEYGHCQPEALTIRVNSTVPQQHQQDTLLHEVMHAIESFYDIDIGEENVRRMASALLTVLQANPQLVRYLTKKTDA